jgi:MOSC domain-containing protein YiiM
MTIPLREPGSPLPRGDLHAGTSSLRSVNVGLPRSVEWQGELCHTSIFKDPVEGRVRVGPDNLAGDRQADLSVHGGTLKAIYLYPSEHYAYWRAELGDLPWGAFGENLTTTGLTEDTVRIGDRLRVGTAELVVTQPRLPCFKLSIRFGRPDIERLFLRSGRTGFYLSVAREGDVAAGDAVAFVSRAEGSATVAEVVGLYGTRRPDREVLRRLVAFPDLPESLRERFRRQLQKPGG